MQLDPTQLATLSAVLRLGSFEAAARALGVTPPAVTQRIKALEDQVGRRLVHRSTPSTATEAGARLAKHAEDVGLLETRLRQDLKIDMGPAAARLRVAVNADSLATWIIPALVQTDDFLFDLVVDDQDHSADWLRRGAVSAAVTAAGPAISGCDRTALGSLRYVATASPAFVARWFADGISADSLARAPCLIFNAKDQLQLRWMARETGARPAPPGHFLPSSHAFVEAAQLGLGWGMNPAHLVTDALARGTLVPLGRDPMMDVALDWQVSGVMARPLAPLTRAIRAAARSGLTPPS
ncbi:MAG: LysR family transcriptional regulator ArgP [Marinibacterium sp.]|nr:LysR family transcriptional regulator ArgP [Marinibacterium sp.]